MWNVEETVKINKDSKHGWGWLRLGLTGASPHISSRLQRPPPGHTGLLPDAAQLCLGQRVSQVPVQPASSLSTFLTYLCDNVYQALEPEDIASILALVYHAVLAIEPAGGMRKVDHAHVH